MSNNLYYKIKIPYRSRIDAPGALHHIIIRDIERKNIFKDDANRDNFLERLKIFQTTVSQTCVIVILNKDANTDTGTE